jgi:hypothetical protein
VDDRSRRGGIAYRGHAAAFPYLLDGAAPARRSAGRILVASE